MTDVFKKINDMLKEKKDDYDDIYRIFKKGGDKQLAYTTHEILNVIKSIRQMIGEMEKEYNNGWIPCSERLPSREEYQKCNGQFIVSDGNRTYATYFDIYDTLKFGEPTMDKFKVDKCVIAWMPLPTPYKPKGEK